MLYLLIYISSGLATWLLLRYIYIKFYDRIAPDLLDVVLVICPIINTIVAVWLIVALLGLPIKKFVSRLDIKKFFKL